MTDTLSVGILGAALGAIYNVGLDNLGFTSKANLTRTALMGLSTALAYNFDSPASCKWDGALWQPVVAGTLYTVGSQLAPGGKNNMANTFIEGFAIDEIIYFGGDWALNSFGLNSPVRCPPTIPKSNSVYINISQI
eukprot:TRINITY_DN4164_c0_g2_i11.p1 TRINITY_DN4164_c0_g2~~TRINITY_DN4164_c0_g2_i11.p1  ORF type:complete len:136 (+),score=43.78 TRINITY_DN4164_c0_g2_i11:251-658(+)